MNRRKFIRNACLSSAAVVLSRTKNFVDEKPKNKLPKWKGFNLTDFNTPDPSGNRRSTTEDHLKWMHDWGFDFVRLPIAYPYYLNFDRSRNITPEEVYQIDDGSVEKIDKLVQLAHKHNLHVCLNLHRAPDTVSMRASPNLIIYGKMMRRRKHFIFTGITGRKNIKIFLTKK